MTWFSLQRVSGISWHSTINTTGSNASCKSARRRATSCTTRSAKFCPARPAPGADLEDVLANLDGAGIEILEEPKEFDKKIEEEDLLDLELLPAGVGEKVNDPVRMYLREMGTVPLLTREGEIEIARRIERGQNAVLKALSRSPLVIRELLAMGEEMRRATLAARDVIQVADPILTDEIIEEKTGRSSSASSTKWRASTARSCSAARSCRPSRAASSPSSTAACCGNWPRNMVQDLAAASASCASRATSSGN